MYKCIFRTADPSEKPIVAFNPAFQNQSVQMVCLSVCRTFLSHSDFHKSVSDLDSRYTTRCAKCAQSNENTSFLRQYLWNGSTCELENGTIRSEMLKLVSLHTFLLNFGIFFAKVLLPFQSVSPLYQGHIYNPSLPQSITHPSLIQSINQIQKS